MKRYFREWSVFFAFLAVLLLLAFRAPEFFQPAQLLSMLCDAVPVLITACGMTLVIICRQIDISIGSQFALCSVFAGLAASNGWPMPVVGIVAVLCGVTMGAFNGALVAFLGIPSIVVTLATMVTWREALRWWREGEFVSNLPDSFQWFGLGQQAGQFTIITVAILLFLFLAFALKCIQLGALFTQWVRTRRQQDSRASIPRKSPLRYSFSWARSRDSRRC
jgi:rhamnose transport system permease protein